MKQFITLLYLISMTCCWSFAAESSSQIAFDAANQDFEQGRKLAVLHPEQAQKLYAQAILKYEQLAQQPDSATSSLYENLANTYFVVGDRGRAVLNYHRSLTEHPLNQNVLHSLDYMRNDSIDALEFSMMQKVNKVLLSWHHWPIWLRFSCFIIAHLVFWGLLAVAVYKRSLWVHRSRGSRACVLIAGVCSVAFALSLLSTHWRWGNPVDAVIIEKEVTARQGNGVIYDNAFTTVLHAGTEFSIIEQRGDWFHAELLNGDKCWLPERAVELVVNE